MGFTIEPMAKRAVHGRTIKFATQSKRELVIQPARPPMAVSPPNTLKPQWDRAIAGRGKVAGTLETRFTHWCSSGLSCARSLDMPSVPHLIPGDGL